jgi:hypothetical protein
MSKYKIEGKEEYADVSSAILVNGTDIEES